MAIHICIGGEVFEPVTSLTITLDEDDHNSHIALIIVAGIKEINRLADLHVPIEEYNMRHIVEVMRLARNEIERKIGKLIDVAIYWECSREWREYIWVRSDCIYPCYLLDVRRGELLKMIEPPKNIIQTIINNYRKEKNNEMDCE